MGCHGPIILYSMCPDSRWRHVKNSSCSSKPRIRNTAMTKRGRCSKGSTPRRCSMSDRKSTRLNSSHLVISYAVFSSACCTLSLHDALPIFTAVFGMLFLNGLPRPYHPLFNVPRFALATREKFFLLVEASDPKYSYDETRAMLEGLDAQEVFDVRSEEHTSELQSPCNLVCRLLFRVLHSFPTRRSSDLHGCFRDVVFEWAATALSSFIQCAQIRAGDT